MASNSTTGLGVAAKIVITSPFNGKGYQVQELSLSQTSPDSSVYQIEAQVQDLAGNEQLGATLTLTSVANFSGTSPADTVYTGTITGGRWHIWQQAPAAGPWSGWASLGGYLMDDSAIG